MKQVLVFFITLSSFSQERFPLLDSISKQPIPYANIVLFSKGNIIGGTYTDKLGLLSIGEEIDSIKITSLGYKDKSISKRELTHILFLTPIVYNLEEVVVTNKTTTCKKTINIGYYRQKKSISIHLLKNSELTTLISNNFKKEFVVRNIYFELKNNSTKILPIRLKIYANVNGPNELLFSNDIEVTASNKKKNYKLNIYDADVKFPKEGVFVGFEYLQSNDNDKVYISATNKAKGSGTFIKDKFWKMNWNSFDNHFYRKLIAVKGNINLAVGLDICKP